jgi:hypothetical protein
LRRAFIGRTFAIGTSWPADGSRLPFIEWSNASWSPSGSASASRSRASLRPSAQ